MAILTVTINTPAAGKFGETRHSERAHLAQALASVAQKIGDGVSTSGNVDLPSNPGCGGWTYTPVAAS
jgi:hypothetical protein